MTAFRSLESEDLTSYAALRQGAVCFDHAPWHISRYAGSGAAAALNGLVTNDVESLAAARGLYAAALTAKGKMLADVVVLRIEPEVFQVVTSAEAGAAWWAVVRKYVNPRLAKYSDESAATTALGVYGPSAMSVLARLGGAAGGGAMLAEAFAEAFAKWPDWANAAMTIAGANMRVVKAPLLGAVPGYLLLLDRTAVESIGVALAGAGVLHGSSRLWDLAALESGRPVWGPDMNDTTIPQEANLESWAAISFDKGCYTGQETVARIHFRGHVNRHLRGLRAESGLRPDAQVLDANGKLVGDVRRSGMSPRLGSIGIAMIRREIPEGSTVYISAAPEHVNVTQQTAVVVSLPFDH